MSKIVENEYTYLETVSLHRPNENKTMGALFVISFVLFESPMGQTGRAAFRPGRHKGLSQTRSKHNDEKQFIMFMNVIFHVFMDQ